MPKRAEPVTEESQLKALLASPTGLNGLIDFLGSVVQKAEEEFVEASKKAVFSLDARMDAVHKHGVMKGFQVLHQRLVDLRTNGK